MSTETKRKSSPRTGIRTRVKKKELSDETTPMEVAVPKKRGRKPKGGKIMDINVSNDSVKITKPNIILHLKCYTSELSCDDERDSNFSKVSICSYNAAEYDDKVINYTKIDNENSTCVMFGSNDPPSIADIEYKKYVNYDNVNNNKHSKDLNKKLKNLEHLLHINSVPNTNTSCFWCTYDFDTSPIYIPKLYLKQTYHVYGYFCSPECAVAHLMKENIDSSCKFERYSWLNSIYKGVYKYSNNIKPAPDPHYMLSRFSGNLSIQEYRELLDSNRLFLIIDKPITRILPEIHEDNDDFIINNKLIPTASNYQVRRKTTSVQSASKNSFGIFAGGEAI